MSGDRRCCRCRGRRFGLVVVGVRVDFVVVGFKAPVLAAVFDRDVDAFNVGVVGVVDVDVDISCKVRSQVRRRTGTTMALLLD
jgi:hypothetical protein